MIVRVIAVILLFYSLTVLAADPPASPLTEEHLLLMQPILDDVPYETTLPVYHVGDVYFLPLKALAEISELGITVTPDKGRAEGWVLHNNDSFLLNIEQQKISVGGKKLVFPQGKVLYNNEDIFVEQKVLESWLPLRFAANPQTLTLPIKASVLLPAQQRTARKQQWGRMKARQKTPPERQKETVPYQLISWPFVDFSAGHNYSRTEDDHNTGYNYSMRAGADAGYLSTQFFASGERDQPLDTIRLTAGRKDSDATLLGPLKATEFALGDINSVPIPLVASVGDGRGVMLSNRTLNRSSAIDTTDFTGDAMPGSDVELYRNGILLDAQAVGEAGRYEFINVPILYGNNSFRLVFYGPQGQRQEELKNIMTSDSMLHQGEVTYAVSLNEKYTSLVPLNDSRPFSFVSTLINGEEVIENVPEQEGIRMIGVSEYGLLPHLTMSVGVAHIPLATDPHDYVTTGFRTSLLDKFLLSQDIGYDASAGGTVERTSLLTNLHGVNLKAEHSLYSDFSDEMQEREGKTLRAVSLGEITLPVPYFPMINTGIVLKERQFIGDESETSFLHRLSSSYRGISITHTIGQVENRAPTMRSVSTTGQMALSGTVKEISLRAAGSYSVQDSGLAAVGFSAQKHLKKKLVLVSGATQDFMNNNRVVAFSSLNWDIGTAKISLKLDGNSEQDMFIGTNISFSLARMPSAQEWRMQSDNISASGGVEARAFLDKNNDGLFNEEDEWIRESSVKVGSKKIIAQGNKAAFGVGIASDVSADITMDESSLTDPLWIYPHKGYSITPRPGIVTPLTFPVIASSEIDGTVSQITPKGKVPVARITVELIDKEGNSVQKVRSEFDGVYNFSRVIPGTYLLKIAPEELESKHLTANSQHLAVSGMGDVYSGRDFTLLEKNSE